MRLYLSSYRLGNKPEEFVKLLRGGKRVAVIMNAADGSKTKAERVESLEREFADLRGLGLEPHEVDLRDYFGGNPGLRAALTENDGLWVRGGNMFVLARAFKQSGAGEIVRDLLDKDALVYAGYSAGIDMLCSSFHGVELCDPPDIVPEGYESEIPWEGLGLLHYSVAPHYKSDHPESAMIDDTVEYMIDNHIPFIALRDGEAIVRDGEHERVIT